MRYLVPITIASLALAACGGGQPATSPAVETQAQAEATSGEAPAAAPETSVAESDAGEPHEFVVRQSDAPKGATSTTPSKIKPTRTEAALKLIVVDKDKGPVRGIVISLTSPDGKKYYTDETNAEGYTELLVPVGQKYELVYLSLARREIGAAVSVSDEPNQNIRLTLRYKRYTPPPRATEAAPAPGLVLEGVVFDTGKASIRAESFPQLDGVAEYMTYKKSARIEVSGHTDNVGNPKINKALSAKRAQACRDYLISKGVDGSRIEAVGYGDERPIAPNDSEEGRQKNRRIEATEL